MKKYFIRVFVISSQIMTLEQIYYNNENESMCPDSPDADQVHFIFSRRLFKYSISGPYCIHNCTTRRFQFLFYEQLAEIPGVARA